MAALETYQKWIASQGGPLLLLPEAYLSSWEGILTPSHHRIVEANFCWNQVPNAPATDYDRACDLKGYVNLITVGEGNGLVFGDEPLNTAIWPQHLANSVVFVRLYYAPEDAVIEDKGFLTDFGDIPEIIWQKTDLRLNFPHGCLYVFDAALPGREVLRVNDTKNLNTTLSEGCYLIETAIYNPTEETSFLLHRLRRIGE